MARKEITTYNYFDDIDGSQLSAETVATRKFSVNGKNYVLDLSEEHAKQFDEALVPYITAARIDTSANTTKRRNRNTAPQKDYSQLRAWAKREGIPVASRGRIKTEIIDAYKSKDPEAIAALRESDTTIQPTQIAQTEPQPETVDPNDN